MLIIITITKGDARINRHSAALLDPGTSDQFAATIASISVRPARFTRMTQPIFHARPFMVSNARYKTMERGVTHFAGFQACESFFRSRANPDESIGSKKSAFRRRVYGQASVNLIKIGPATLKGTDSEEPLGEMVVGQTEVDPEEV